MPCKFKWLTRSWWAYVWQSPVVYYGRKDTIHGWDGTEGKWRVRWCRLRGHDGIIFYNAGGLEPDNRCRRCLERIA